MQIIVRRFVIKSNQELVLTNTRGVAWVISSQAEQALSENF